MRISVVHQDVLMLDNPITLKLCGGSCFSCQALVSIEGNTGVGMCYELRSCTNGSWKEILLQTGLTGSHEIPDLFASAIVRVNFTLCGIFGLFTPLEGIDITSYCVLARTIGGTPNAWANPFERNRSRFSPTGCCGRLIKRHLPKVENRRARRLPRSFFSIGAVPFAR